MKIINNNINFNGYKNVIYNNIESPMFNFRFMSMELNDEGKKDLTEFKKIQNLCINEDWGNTLHLLNSKVGNSVEILLMNGRSMFMGDEIRLLYEKYANSDEYKDAYKREERATLKAYTLIAGITRRMLENPLCSFDKGMKDVIQSAMAYLTPIFNNDKSKAFNVLQMSLMNKGPIEEIASYFNNFVAKNMQIFFK